jgi:hypothetical protein
LKTSTSKLTILGFNLCEYFKLLKTEVEEAEESENIPQQVDTVDS